MRTFFFKSKKQGDGDRRRFCARNENDALIVTFAIYIAHYVEEKPFRTTS